MKPSPRRVQMLDRLARFRRIERLQALDEVSATASEYARIHALHSRSRDMLENVRDSAKASGGSELTSLLAFRGQLTSLAQSTEELRAQADSRASHARKRLRAADQRLDMVEDRAAEAARVLARKSHSIPAHDPKLARGLHSSGRHSAKQGKVT